MLQMMNRMKKIYRRIVFGLVVGVLVFLSLPQPSGAVAPAARFSPLSGYLVQAGPQGLLIDCGRRKGVEIGDLFVVLQPGGPPLVHPVTGKPMGVQERRLATLKVVRVEADYSICRPLRRYLQVPLRRGLPVRRFALMAALFIDLNGNGAALFSRVREMLSGLDWADYNLGLRYRDSLRRPGGPGALGFDLYVVNQGPELTFYNGDQELVGAWPAELFSAAGTTTRKRPGSGSAGGKYTMSTEDASQVVLSRYRTMDKIRLVVKGVDAGDLDGDGTTEIVFTDGEKIFVYRVTPEGLKFRYRYLFDKWGSIVNISVGDIDGDRRDEIIVNIFKETEDGFSSFVLGVRNGHYQRLVEHVPFVMGLLGGRSVADRGCLFVGQGFAAETLFGGKVYLLKYAGDKVLSQEKFAVPQGFTLPGALYADVNHDGRRELCFINPNNFLEIYRGDKRLWMSDERLGGSLLDVQYEVGTAKVSYTEKRQICSPMRFLDVDGDGRRELVVCDNKSGMSTSFGDYGFLSQGYVKMVRNTGTGFMVAEVTGRIGGPIQGMLPLGSELVVAMVKRGEDLLKQSGSTFLLAFPLPAGNPERPGR